MSKKWRARVVEMCVESALLFDSAVGKILYMKDVARMQKWIDKCYRYYGVTGMVIQ